jgi:hypothetical protein
VERRHRIEAQAAADREVRRRKEKESRHNRLVLVEATNQLVEVTIEVEEEAVARDPVVDFVQSRVRGVLDQVVRRWASPPDQEGGQYAQGSQEQRAPGPQGWGEIHLREEDPGEQVLRTRLLSREDSWIEQLAARPPRYNWGP